jgi:segregation and condensation protein B
VNDAPIDVLEALLFASDAPLEPERIREVLGLTDLAGVRGLVDELRARLDSHGRALQIAEAAGGYRMVTRPEIAPWLVRLARSRTRARLSRPAVETLAIVAYRQPVSRPEIDAIRGVNSEGVLDSLLERRLVRIGGRKEAPGRPFLYETTRDFLVAFGLRDLGELPKVDGELLLPDLGLAPTAATNSATDLHAERVDGAPPGTDVVDATMTDVDAEREVADVAAADAAVDTDLADAGTGVVTRERDVARAATGGETDAAGRGGDITGEAEAVGALIDGEDPTQQAPGAGGPLVETGR